MYKVCRVCKLEKQKTCFYKHKEGKYGVGTRCKDCDKEYYQANVIKILETGKKYWRDNNNRILARRRQLYKQKQESKKWLKMKYRANRKVYQARWKIYYAKNRDKLLAKDREDYLKKKLCK